MRKNIVITGYGVIAAKKYLKSNILTFKSLLSPWERLTILIPNLKIFWA